MRVIYKYQVDLVLTGAPQEVKLPRGATILPVAMQEGECLSFWAEVPVQHGAVTSDVTRLFNVHATGQAFERTHTRFGETYLATYVATAATPGLVWHLYELVSYDPNDPT